MAKDFALLFVSVGEVGEYFSWREECRACCQLKIFRKGLGREVVGGHLMVVPHNFGILSGIQHRLHFFCGQQLGKVVVVPCVGTDGFAIYKEPASDFVMDGEHLFDKGSTKVE